MKIFVFIALLLGLSWFSFGCAEDTTPAWETVTILKVYEERRVGDVDHTTIVRSVSGHRYRLKGMLGDVGDSLVVDKSYFKYQ